MTVHSSHLKTDKWAPCVTRTGSGRAARTHLKSTGQIGERGRSNHTWCKPSPKPKAFFFQFNFSFYWNPFESVGHGKSMDNNQSLAVPLAPFAYSIFLHSMLSIWQGWVWVCTVKSGDKNDQEKRRPHQHGALCCSLYGGAYWSCQNPPLVFHLCFYTQIWKRSQCYENSCRFI